MTKTAYPGYAEAIEAKRYLEKHLRGRPRAGIILGSGQGEATARLRDAERIAYRAIPHFARPTVPGHAGVLHVGHLGNINNKKGHPEGSIFWGDAGPLRAGKGSCYEAGYRVPCIVVDTLGAYFQLDCTPVDQRVVCDQLRDIEKYSPLLNHERFQALGQ